MPDKNNGGAPIGNRNSAKNKIWTRAIQEALEKRSRSDRYSALQDLAEKLLMKCDEGDMTALKELGDRLEGKPMQSVEMNVTRNAANMGDSELIGIITESSSSRIASEKASKDEPGSVH